MADTPPKTKYQSFTTQYFKTHFAQILRDIHLGLFDAAIITAHGRKVGVFFPHPETMKSFKSK